MKIKKWPFWPVLAMGSLIALVAVIEVNGTSASQKVECAHYSNMCGTPAVTINQLFIP